MEPLDQYKNPNYEEFLDLDKLEKDQTQKFVKISCPCCNNQVPSDNLNLEKAIGKCGSCDAVFPFDENIKKLTDKVQKGTSKVLRPEGIEMFYFGDELEMSFGQHFDWFDFVMFFITFLGTMFGFMYWLESGSGILQLMLGLSPLILGIAYLIKRLKFKKYIKVNKDNIHVMLRPNKLLKDKSYAVSQVQQLYTVGGYLMMMVDEGKGQKHIKLATTNTVSKAKFLEQEIESFLNIEDVAVPGER